MNNEFLRNLRDKEAHTRYQALKAVSADEAAMADPEVRKLVVRICNRDKLPYNRIEAMTALKGIWPAPEAVDALSARLDDDPDIAEYAIQILGQLRDDSACSLLCRTFLEARSMRVRLQVIQSFRGADQASIFQFLKATGAHDSKDDRIRATIVTLLGEVGNATLKSVFLKALQDPNARVRANAVEALSSICEGKELAQILAHCLKDRNNRVRANALAGLVRLGVKQAEPLVHEMAHHQNPRYRSSAAWVLGEVGHRVACGRQWLEELSKDGDHNVIYRAELALESIDAVADGAVARVA